MTPNTKLGLDELFGLQDAAAEAHLAESELLRRAYLLLSDVVAFNARILHTTQFEAEKQTVVRTLAVDTLSHVIVAIRLALWGALPESLAVWRGALESGAQLKLVVEGQRYKSFIHEMTRKLDRVSYEAAFSQLGELGASIEKLHGRISEMAAHSTAKRLALVAYEFEGKDFDRFGFARKLEHALYPTYYYMVLAMMVSDALYVAHEQENRPFPLATELSLLLSRFDSICKEFQTTFPKLSEGSAVSLEGSKQG